MIKTTYLEFGLIALVFILIGFGFGYIFGTQTTSKIWRGNDGSS